MTKREKSYQKMIQTVSGLLKQEAARFENKPTISALIARLDPFDASITRYFGLQSTGIAALREQHENNRALLEGNIRQAANAFLVVFRGAKMSSEVMLLEAAMLGLGQKADNQLKAITETVCNTGLPHVQMVADFGITANSLEAMQQQAVAFHENTTLIELKRDNKIDATARLVEVFADCRTFLSKELDPAMKALFALQDPEFLSLYLKAREVNYRTRHRNPETTDEDLPLVTLVFSDAETHQPVEGVSVAINGVINSEISDTEGELYLDTLEPGSYHVAAAVPGYQSIEWDTPPLEAGLEYTFEKPLSPETSG